MNKFSKNDTQQKRLQALESIQHSLGNITNFVIKKQKDSFCKLDQTTINIMNDLINQSSTHNNPSIDNTSSLIDEICDLISLKKHEIPQYKKQKHLQTKKILAKLTADKLNEDEITNILNKANYDKLLLEELDVSKMSKEELTLYLSNKKKQLQNYLNHFNEAKKSSPSQVLLTLLTSLMTLVRITAKLIFDPNATITHRNIPITEIEKIRGYTHQEIQKKAISSLNIEDLINLESSQGGSIFESYLQTIAHELNINWEEFGIHANIEHTNENNSHQAAKKTKISY